MGHKFDRCFVETLYNNTLRHKYVCTKKCMNIIFIFHLIMSTQDFTSTCIWPTSPLFMTSTSFSCIIGNCGWYASFGPEKMTKLKRRNAYDRTSVSWSRVVNNVLDGVAVILPIWYSILKHKRKNQATKMHCIRVKKVLILPRISTILSLSFTITPCKTPIQMLKCAGSIVKNLLSMNASHASLRHVRYVIGICARACSIASVAGYRDLQHEKNAK